MYIPSRKLTVYKLMEVYVSNMGSHFIQCRHLLVNNGYCYCINFKEWVM